MANFILILMAIILSPILIICTVISLVLVIMIIVSIISLITEGIEELINYIKR